MLIKMKVILDYNNRRMQKIEDLRQQYLKDVEQMASKSRFGYFSIPPFATAGANPPQKPQIIKNPNGTIQSSPRNIFPGLSRSGVLKKSYFNYQTSVYQGDPYIEPARYPIQHQQKPNKKQKQIQVFKPANLIKQPQAKSVYEHLPQKYYMKNKKDYVDGDGRIRVENRNIVVSSLRRIGREKGKEFSYVSEPYDTQKIVQREQMRKSIKLRGEMPFKSSSPSKPLFYTNRQTYSIDGGCLKKQDTNKKHKHWQAISQHDSKFKPSSCKKYDIFSSPEYMPNGAKLPQTTRVPNGRQNFRGSQIMVSSKPSPSIALLKTNMLRGIR